MTDARPCVLEGEAAAVRRQQNGDPPTLRVTKACFLHSPWEADTIAVTGSSRHSASLIIVLKQESYIGKQTRKGLRPACLDLTSMKRPGTRDEEGPFHCSSDGNSESQGAKATSRSQAPREQVRPTRRRNKKSQGDTGTPPQHSGGGDGQGSTKH